MKIRSFLASIIAIIITLGLCTAEAKGRGANKTPKVVITTPTDNATITANTVWDFKWTSANISKKQQLVFKVGPTMFGEVPMYTASGAATTANTGSQKFLVPNVPNGQYVIYVYVQGNAFAVGAVTVWIINPSI